MFAFAYHGEAAALATAAAWTASTFLWSSIGNCLTPKALNAFRTCAAFLLLSALAVVAGRGADAFALASEQLALLAVSGVIGLAVGDAFYYYSLLALGPRRALVLWLMAPPLTALLGVPFLGEHLPPGAWAAIGITVAGVVAVQWDREPGAQWAGRPLNTRAVLLGVAAGLASAVGHATSSILTKSVLVEGVGVLVVTQVRLGAAALFLLLMGAATGRLRGWTAPYRDRRTLAIALVAVGVGSVLGLYLMTYSQGAIPVGLANTLSSLSPVFALPVAAWLGQERLRMRTLFWTAVAFAGVAAIFLRGYSPVS